MLNAFLFDQRRGEPVEDWVELAAGLGDNQLLWVDLEEPGEEELRTVAETFSVVEPDRISTDVPGPRVAHRDGQISLTVAAVDDEAEGGPAAFPVRCVVGLNWVVTHREREVPVFREFREQATGASELGVLDGASFLAALLDWAISSYLRAFEAVEEHLEEFDVSVLSSPVQDGEKRIGDLVGVRRRIGALRRSLAPQRELFTALSHAELDPISTTESAERFAQLAGRVDVALGAARDAKDSVVGSFDVLIARSEHRTNEIMKVLTLASVLLLPGALIAGVMGMNFKVGLFSHAVYFWVVVAVIVGLGAVTTAAARARRWI
jgi:magnesium transporter